MHGGKEAGNIDVFIQDANKNIVYKRTDETQGIILFDTTVPGEYSFVFSNSNDSKEKIVTLAIHTN